MRQQKVVGFSYKVSPGPSCSRADKHYLEGLNGLVSLTVEGYYYIYYIILYYYNYYYIINFKAFDVRRLLKWKFSPRV